MRVGVYLGGMADVETIGKRFKLLEGMLNEKLRRCVAAAEAEAIGRGGASIVSRATGVSRRAIRVGAQELKERDKSAAGRIRKPGGGRKRTVEKDATLELKRMGHQTSHRMVAELLHGLDYSLQGNRKTIEGSFHPDRNAQFEHINRKVKEHLRTKDPVISVDTKKKELVGNFKNGGREWRPKGDPEQVRIHDFVVPELGRAVPYGVYDLGQNAGWVSVGIDHDTASFAVETIRRWWYSMGRPSHREAKRLLITADAGGSNGPKIRLWRVELQKLP